MFESMTLAIEYSFTGSPSVPLDCIVRASDARNVCWLAMRPRSLPSPTAVPRAQERQRRDTP